MSMLALRKFKIMLRSASGRNCFGHLTAFRKGGGLKKNLVLIDNYRQLYNVPAIVINIIYDSFRSSFVSLILYKTGLLSYILTPRALNTSDVVFSSRFVFLYKTGDRLPLRFIQIGILVHNVEFYPNSGGKLLRSAGVYGKVWRHYGMFTVLKLRSGEERLFSGNCMATVGVVSNENHHLKKYYKAGVLRNLGIRPVVRGVAMNPVDHPSGGRTKGGTPFTDRWGNLSKGGRTSKFKKSFKSKLILRSRFQV